MKTFIKKSFIVFLFATAFMFLVGNIIHIGNKEYNYVDYQILYDLDYPQTQLNNHSLREVFENRNMAMPDLSNATNLGDGWYELYKDEFRDFRYNVFSGDYNLNYTGSGSSIASSIGKNIFKYPIGKNKYTITMEGDYSIAVFDNNDNNIKVANQNIAYLDNSNGDIDFLYLYSSATRNHNFKLQIEEGSTATPYQVPTNGPYNNIDIGTLNLSTQQINYWFEIYNTLKGLE